jgi:hypothetical protein
MKFLILDIILLAIMAIAQQPLVAIPRTSVAEHAPSVTSCPCYEPSKPNCGIQAFTKTITATPTNCPEPTEGCSNGIPRILAPELFPGPRCNGYGTTTLYRNRCTQQVTKTMSRECYTNRCFLNSWCNSGPVVMLEGIGPTEKPLATRL